MLKRKRIGDKGKISFTRFFQKFKTGDSVAVARELNLKFGYSKRIQGRTGKVISKRGSAYEIELYDLDKQKRYMIKPVHLKRIK